MNRQTRQFIRQCFNMHLTVQQAYDDAKANGIRVLYPEVRALYLSFESHLDAVYAN